MIRILRFLIFGRWKCHEWAVVDVQPYRDTSYTSQGVPSVNYTQSCRHCGKLKSGDIYGCSARTPLELEVHMLRRGA